MTTASGTGLAVCGRRVRAAPVVALACTDTGVGDAGTSILEAAMSPSCEVPATAVAAGFSSTVTAVSPPDADTRVRSAVYISSDVSFCAFVVVSTGAPAPLASLNACSFG